MGKTKLEKGFQYSIEMLNVLRERKGDPEELLRMFLQVGECADLCELEGHAYEALAQGLTLYEEDISDSRQQIQCLNKIVGTIQALRNVGQENYDTLSTKACQYSSKLLKKPDQCQAAVLCSHLFWSKLRRDEGKVLECLQRSLKIVEGCMSSQQIQLFVHILNHYLYHFSNGNEKVTVKYLNVLMELIHTNISKSEEEKPEGGTSSLSVQTFFEHTMRHIRANQASDAPDAERWSAINTAPS
eukprot:NODE_3319_length_912_cov_67.044586_g3297_i0.p1 GENE.NODE_3319_length_912_cov_67.044586_g3297_i0~~NODE_3319_length_912_cov_67.044586_g3297_i0.p1  ORF type:complete len:272 (+),score=65.92 NODE_3319_length_912_cov_67.044586_g3297_i0:88-816(+)